MNRLILTFLIAILPYSALAGTISGSELSDAFKDYHACFILYDIEENKVVSEYNPEDYCNQRISPDSTFKLALSLMAFDKGVISPRSTFKWNGRHTPIPDHNHNQTPKSWLQHSVLWVSQKITPKLGRKAIQHYLADFDYGNQDFSGDPGKHNGLTHAWLSSSLKISAIEQLHLLKAMLKREIHISKRAIVNTKKNIYLGKLNDQYKLYGKTGSGRHLIDDVNSDTLLRDGWFIGVVEGKNKKYIFVSNLTDKKFQATIDEKSGHLKPYGSELLKPITIKLLNSYFS